MKSVVSLFGIAAVLLAMNLGLAGSEPDGLARKKKKCPARTAKFVRVCIEKEVRPDKLNFDAAVLECFKDKRRLPTSAELVAFGRRDSITLGSIGSSGAAEWTSDFIHATPPPAESLAITEQESGDFVYFEVPHHFVALFRCVA